MGEVRMIGGGGVGLRFDVGFDVAEVGYLP